jgi:hypothetical protein
LDGLGNTWWTAGLGLSAPGFASAMIRRQSFKNYAKEGLQG